MAARWVGTDPSRELEEILMPAHQRLGIDHVQCVPPSAAMPGRDKSETAVIAVDPRSANTTTETYRLLTERSILGQKFRLFAGGVSGGTHTYFPLSSGPVEAGVGPPERVRRAG